MIGSYLFLGLSAASSALAATSWIAPGAVWYDTAGKKIDAHGGGVHKFGSYYYWTGHACSDNVRPYVYRSTDLLNWENLGAQGSATYVWRPKHAKPNSQYWIFGQQDRYSLSLASSSVTGGYSTKNKVHLPPSDYTYSDTGMYYDESSSTWYLLTSADHNTIQVNKINSDGSVGERTSKVADGELEAPGIFKSGSTYFMIVSGKTGYRANPNTFYYTSSLSGTWTKGGYIAPTDQNTYNSQNTHEFIIKGSSATTYVFMGDAWDSKGTAASNYVWLPIAVNANSKTVTLQYHEMWKVDVNTGVVSYPSAAKLYEAASARLSGRAALAACDHCVTKRSVQNIDAGSEVTFNNIAGTGEPQWFSFRYTVNDPEAGQAHILVNGEPVATNISDFNSRAGYHDIVPVQLTLNEGTDNTITFGANGREGFTVSFEGIQTYKDA